MVEIRPALMTDVALLKDIFSKASLSNEGDRDALLANPDALELPIGAIQEGRTRVATVEDDRVVAFASTAMLDEFVEVEDLFVLPEWMGRGLGRALVEDIVAAAEARGALRVEVTANHHALAFYSKLGFVFDREVTTRFGIAPRLRLDLPRRA